MMRRRIAITLLFALTALLGASAARGEFAQKGNLRISFDGGFTPRSLPRDRPAPITASVEGSIGTTDGSHPPALRVLEVALNRNGRLSTLGLPACTSGLLQSTSSNEALRRCRPAIVGDGEFSAMLQSSEGEVPVRGKVLAFNGRSGGRPAILLHFAATTPVQATLVLPFVVSHRAEGQFGTALTAKIPILAGGVGSITDVKLKIGREYGYRGQRRSFISASCAAPSGFPGAVFPFARGSFHFEDGRVINTTLSRDCRVR
jgi:hypothetical protein